MSGQSSSPSSAEIARRLWAPERVPGPSRDGEAPTPAQLQQLCTRITGNLSDTMGRDGCTALLARALTRTEGAHPVLTSIRQTTNGEIVLDGVAASVESHGGAAVTAGLEALVAALMDILGRLIGEEMALRVMLPDLQGGPSDRGDSS